MSGSLTSTFREVQFPSDISYGSKGGSKFSTTVFTSSSGREQRNVNWSISRGEWDVTYGVKSLSQMQTLITFFMAMQGRAYAFRFKDWADFQITNQQIAVGNGTQLQFQIVKTYTTVDMISSNPYTFTRNIVKPVPGTLSQGILVNSVLVPVTNYTIDYTLGMITFIAGQAPANGALIVIPYLEFDLPARFDTDALDVAQDFYNVESWHDFKVTEIKL